MDDTLGSVLLFPSQGAHQNKTEGYQCTWPLMLFENLLVTTQSQVCDQRECTHEFSPSLSLSLPILSFSDLFHLLFQTAIQGTNSVWYIYTNPNIMVES